MVGEKGRDVDLRSGYVLVWPTRAGEAPRNVAVERQLDEHMVAGKFCEGRIPSCLDCTQLL